MRERDCPTLRACRWWGSYGGVEELGRFVMSAFGAPRLVDSDAQVNNMMEYSVACLKAGEEVEGNVVIDEIVVIALSVGYILKTWKLQCENSLSNAGIVAQTSGAVMQDKMAEHIAVDAEMALADSALVP